MLNLIFQKRKREFDRLDLLFPSKETVSSEKLDEYSVGRIDRNPTSQIF